MVYILSLVTVFAIAIDIILTLILLRIYDKLEKRVNQLEDTYGAIPFNFTRTANAPKYRNFYNSDYQKSKEG